MTADYELVEVSRLLGCKAVKAQITQDEEVWGEKERKVRSTELSTLACAMALKKISAWRNRTVYPAQPAAWPWAWAIKFLPTPGGPTSNTCQAKRSQTTETPKC